MTRNLLPWIILILTLIFDYYGFQAVKSAFQNSSEKTRNIGYVIYFSLTLFSLIYFISFLFFNFRENSTPFSRYLTGVFFGIFVSKLILILLLLIGDVSRGVSYIINKIFQPETPLQTGRRAFLSSAMIGAASLPFFAFIYGMIKTAYDYQIKRINVPIANLPDKLVGLKIVQISDIHSGSFTEIKPIQNAIKMINSLKPDIFVFTGDLVNNKSSEYKDFIEIFKPIQAKYGQYSILGNHDYGDYIQWESDEIKSENLNTLKKYHADTNWDLICNGNRIIDIDGEKLALLGIENWGAGRGWKRYGKMEKTYKGVENIPTKILLSHDPSHWDAQVKSKYADIQLTLSGHTHGMQFGVNNKWLKFSPVQWVYKQWSGLYTEGNQHIYVNTGFGFLGYPGRVGIKPEITELTLVKA